MTPEVEKQLLALEKEARRKLRERTGNIQIHEGIRVHPKYCIPGVKPDTDSQMLELICFSQDWPTELGGLGAFDHLRKYIDITWPGTRWNPWMEDRLRSLCSKEYEHKRGRVRTRFISWVGCGAAGKTHDVGLFACSWFMAAPTRTSITLTSTSKGIISQRVWPVIQKLWYEAQRHGQRWEWGHMLESQKMVQARKGDSKHSICALAVEPGELQGSIDKIKGRHTPRMMLIVDEANSAPQAIFECIPNMLTGVEELIVVVIGNAGSHLDPHGLCCEPGKGWNSISIEDTIWPTRGAPKWGIESGVCLHFDGAKSPNVLAGKTIYTDIYSYERWQSVLDHGPEYRNTLQHWSQDRGFWPPDGVTNTIFSEAMVERCDGKGEITFLSRKTPIAFLDPAFGGDECKVVFGFCGDLAADKLAIQVTEHHIVPVINKEKHEIDYAIALWYKAECEKRQIQPLHAGLDATGTGRGVASILAEIWSAEVLRVEWGGAPSDLSAADDKGEVKPAKELFFNRVTELWYVCRAFLRSGQLKGLYDDAIIQFCARTYEITGKKIKLMPKDECKALLGRSPDDADAVSGLCEVARRVLGAVPEGLLGSKHSPSQNNDWDKWAKRQDSEESQGNEAFYEEPKQSVVWAGEHASNFY